MLSLYLHLPFCVHKCPYCSFFVLPETHTKSEALETLKESYLQQLITQIEQWKERLPEEGLKTLYIGGGTPLQLGKDRLITLIHTVLAVWGAETLEELTIERNPDPFDTVIETIEQIGNAFPQVYRIRHSIGIQSFDDAVLATCKRQYTFAEIQTFLRDLQVIKQPNRCYNLDFIAFGMEQEGKTGWRDDEKRAFFQRIAKSQCFDSMSLYSLEHSQGSDRYHLPTNKRPAFSPEVQTDEYLSLQAILIQAGYHRYELSNYAFASKRSIHNMVYRQQEPYIGIGINATSYLPKALVPSELLPQDSSAVIGVRFQAATQRKERNENAFPYHIQEVVTQPMADLEYCLLGLRTDAGIAELSTYAALLVADRKQQIDSRVSLDLAQYDADHLILTNNGLNVYNTLVTDLFTAQVWEQQEKN